MVYMSCSRLAERLKTEDLRELGKVRKILKLHRINNKHGLYVLIMSSTRFRVNPHSIVA